MRSDRGVYLDGAKKKGGGCSGSLYYHALERNKCDDFFRVRTPLASLPSVGHSPLNLSLAVCRNANARLPVRPDHEEAEKAHRSVRSETEC